MPVRSVTTRTPSGAAFAAASHAVHTSARKPEPAGASSSRTSTGRSPYTPDAEPERNSAGGFVACRIASTSVSVADTRERRISCL